MSLLLKLECASEIIRRAWSNTDLWTPPLQSCWPSGTGMRCQNLHFWQTSHCCWGCRSGDHIWRHAICSLTSPSSLSSCLSVPCSPFSNSLAALLFQDDTRHVHLPRPVHLFGLLHTRESSGLHPLLPSDICPNSTFLGSPSLPWPHNWKFLLPSSTTHYLPFPAFLSPLLSYHPLRY